MSEIVKGGRVTANGTEILVDGRLVAVGATLETAEALTICLQDGAFNWRDMKPERRDKVWRVFGHPDRSAPWEPLEFNYANWPAADELPPATATPGEPEA